MSTRTHSQLLFRSAVVVYVVVILWLCAATVHRLNLDAGGWVLLIGLVNAALLFATVDRFGWGRARYHFAFFVSTLAVFLYVDHRGVWKATTELRTGKEVFLFADDTRYYAPAATPNRVPFAAVNDEWVIRTTGDANCLITWASPADTTTVRAELNELFISRGALPVPKDAPAPGAIPLALLLLISLAAFGELMRHFVREVHWSWAFLRSGRSAALFFVLGVVVASVKLVPTEWLSNNFLSRPDDWLCYEKGARQILAGNVFLLPAPGGVEMWGPLYTYIVASLHSLFGPALGPLHVIMHGLHYVIIWALLGLLSFRSAGLAVATTVGALLFVEVDLNTHYAWRLLSDTLPLVLLPVLLIAWKRGSGLPVLGLLCGLLYLLRLELLGIAPLLLAVILLYTRPKVTRQQVLGFLLPFLACVAAYLVRRHALFNDLHPWPLGMVGSAPPQWLVFHSWDHFVLKTSAIFGQYDQLNPDLRFRYHWLFIHALFLFALIGALGRRLIDRYIAFSLAAWVYVLFTRMVSPSIGIYGHRHSLLLILLEMLVIILVTERFLEKRTATGIVESPRIVRE